MNKEPKTLPQAIKIIVGKYGKDVVKDVQMVNIMSDVVSLEDPAAVKSILRDVIKSGYGAKILSINSPKEDYHLKVKAYSKEISDKFGYKDVIVQYILYSISYGIGICPKEPYLKNLVIPKRDREVHAPNEEDEVEERRFPYKPIAACCLVVLLGVFFWGFRYWKSSADREQFQNMLFSGDTFLSEGDYTNAVENYKEAYKGYNAMNSSRYKEDALEKIDELVDKLIKEGETDSKNLNQAYQLLESELQLDLDRSDKDRLENKKKELEQIIADRVENGRNTLITILSANNGKLDDNGKKVLENLLELSPNDYWLNFIKKKSYE